MRRGWDFLFLSIALLFSGACDRPENDNAKPAPGPNQYFDVAGFVEKQIELLNQEKPRAEKQVIENGKSTETKTLTNVNWRKELELFTELDLNKPAFRNAYNVQVQDSAGFTHHTYRRKPDAEGTVLFLAVTINPQQQVHHLKAVRQNQNTLIYTRQEMQLWCDTKKGKTRVVSYQIQGLQKPVIFDSLQYVIFTKIR